MTSFNPPLVTAFTAGLIILLQMILMGAVIYIRRTRRQSLGDGDLPALQAAIRRHGNLAENGALFLVCLALLEMLGDRRQQVELLAGLFVAGRISHAIGLSLPKTSNLFRTVGIVLTVAAGVMMGWRLLVVGSAVFHG